MRGTSVDQRSLAGPWGCLGKQLAIHQMQIMIAKTFLWHPLLQLADDFDHTAFTEGITHARTTHFAVPLRVRVPGA
jgi:cytochrome P450